MLKRGRTATSLSVPGHQSPAKCVQHTMNILRLQGLRLHDLCGYFPRIEQTTIGGVCLAGASSPRSRYCCKECTEGAKLQVYFGFSLLDIKVCFSSSSAHAIRTLVMFCEVTSFGELTRVIAHCTQVVNIIAQTLFEPSGLFLRTSASSFLRLRHLTLMIDPMRCFFDKPTKLNTSLAEIGNFSQLDSLYIGFIYGFGCSKCGSSTCVRRSADAEDSINLCLSSMQHLELVHLDSFWPALLELPSRACLHATFKSTLGQKHPGL